MGQGGSLPLWPPIAKGRHGTQLLDNLGFFPRGFLRKEFLRPVCDGYPFTASLPPNQLISTFLTLKFSSHTIKQLRPTPNRSSTEILYADGIIDDEEKKFLERLEKSALEACPEFESLYKECMAK
jgi:hypothetical protein